MLEEEYQPRRSLPAHLRPAPEPLPIFEYSIREAVPADLPHVREIYNHYVLNSMVTFDEKPTTLVAMQRKFARAQKAKMPFIVAVSPTTSFSDTRLSRRGRRRPPTVLRWKTPSTWAPRPPARGSARR